MGVAGEVVGVDGGAFGDEAMTGKPVVTAAIATTYAMLKALDLDTYVPGAGALLSGAY